MKLTPIFQFIHDQLEVETQIKLITWYNNQDINGIIHTEPAVFVEFPETLQCQQLREQYQQAELTVRVHLVSKIHKAKDGSISNALVAGHEQIAQLIYHRLHLKPVEAIVQPEGAAPGVLTRFTNTLTRTALQFAMTETGWAITQQDFQCMIYQRPVFPPQKIPMPPPDIQATTIINV
jgi:hypothetical protein